MTRHLKKHRVNKNLGNLTSKALEVFFMFMCLIKIESTLTTTSSEKYSFISHDLRVNTKGYKLYNLINDKILLCIV